MLNKKLAAAILTSGVLGVVSLGFAQGPFGDSGAGLFPGPKQGKSLVDTLDDFGRSLLGGILPGEEEESADRERRRLPARKRYPARSSGGSHAPRAGSILANPSDSTVDRDSSIWPEPKPGSRQYRTTVSPRTAKTTDRGLVYPVEESAQTNRHRVTGSVRAGSAGDGPSRAATKSNPAGLSRLTNPVIRPLHQRLAAFRKSTFADSQSSRPDPDPPPESPAADEPAGMAQQNPTPTRARPPGPTPAGRPVIVQGVAPGVRSQGVATPTDAARPSWATDLRPAGTADPGTGPVAAADPGPTPAATLTATAGPQTPPEQNVLIARRGPILSVETTGPRRIAVGKESAYQVIIQNAGEVAAEDVVVLVDLPEWADVLSAEAGTGTARAATPGEVSGPLQWRVGRLEASSRERLVLRIIPRESRPFDLAIRFDYQPVASQAMIEVQEPKLTVGIDGPREVLYGEQEVYRLRLANTGNGDAENVMITLMPIGTTGNQPVSHNLGSLGAGQDKTVEVELTARQVGNLVIKVDVRAEGGVHAELAETVLVRRAALQLDMQGPKVQYVGAVAEYRIRVRNPGTAPAKNLEVLVNVPPGARYLSGVDGARLAANGTKVLWTLDGLNAGGEQAFGLKCSLGLPGLSRMEVVSKADGDLTASAVAQTRVEAMADLVLDVKDPLGPVPVGEETTYELRIRNRGTKNAEQIEVVTYFSRGIEPTTAEGGSHRIAPGQVIFSPIPAVAAGEDVVLKIRAKAGAAGNHIFRAEVHCKPLGTRLLSEETTLFYQDQPVADQAPSGLLGEGVSPPPAAAANTADRRQSTVTAHDAAPATVAGPPQGVPTPAVRRR